MEPKRDIENIFTPTKVFFSDHASKPALHEGNMRTFSSLFTRDLSSKILQDNKKREQSHYKWEFDNFLETNSDEDAGPVSSWIVPNSFGTTTFTVLPSPIRGTADLTDMVKKFFKDDISLERMQTEANKKGAAKLKALIQRKRSHNRRKWHWCPHCHGADRKAFDTFTDLVAHCNNTHRIELTRANFPGRRSATL